MRVLIVAPRGGAFTYIEAGWVNALTHLGHEARYWSGERSEWDAFQPDIYIGRTGWRQTLPFDLIARDRTKIVLHVNPYGSKRLDPVHGNRSLNEPAYLIEWAVEQKPDLVFGLGWGDDIELYWDRWRDELGLNLLMMPTAGDPFVYYKTAPDPKWACDLAFVGGRWRYKANSIDRYLVPLMGKYDMRIHGWGGWRTWRDWRSLLRSSKIADEDVRVLLSSARIGPVVHEPHSAIYGIDVPERVFKVPLCGALAISDPSASLHRYFPEDILPMGHSPREYRDLIDHYLANEQERLMLADRQRRHVLAHHTYLNRMQSMMAALGFDQPSKDAKRAITTFAQAN